MTNVSCTGASLVRFTVLTLATLSEIASSHVRIVVMPDAETPREGNRPLMSAARDHGAQETELGVDRFDQQLLAEPVLGEADELLIELHVVAVGERGVGLRRDARAE